MKVKGRDKGGMKMYKYEVGQVIERFKGRQEGVLFDMADSTQYSKKLKANIESQKEQNFNELDYARKLNKIFNTYSTKEMVNYSEVSCRIK